MNYYAGSTMVHVSMNSFSSLKSSTQLTKSVRALVSRIQTTKLEVRYKK